MNNKVLLHKFYKLIIIKDIIVKFEGPKDFRVLLDDLCSKFEHDFFCCAIDFCNGEVDIGALGDATLEVERECSSLFDSSIGGEHGFS